MILRSYELTRKDRMYKNIERLQHAKGPKHFNFIPKTFLIPHEYSEFAATHHRMRGIIIYSSLVGMFANARRVLISNFSQIIHFCHVTYELLNQIEKTIQVLSTFQINSFEFCSMILKYNYVVFHR